MEEIAFWRSDHRKIYKALKPLFLPGRKKFMQGGGKGGIANQGDDIRVFGTSESALKVLIYNADMVTRIRLRYLACKRNASISLSHFLSVCVF